MLRTDERQTDGQSGPTIRPAFAKATQVKISADDQNMKKDYPACKELRSIYLLIWNYMNKHKLLILSNKSK